VIKKTMLASICVALLFAAHVSAQSAGDKATAVELYDAGTRLVADGKYAEACPKYAESQRVDPQVGTLLHLADCLEKNGQTASAWAAWRDGAELAAKRGDARETVARDRASVLEPKLSRLTLSVATPDVAGLEVTRDGASVGKALWNTPSPVDPGKHEIEATAPGKKTWHQSVQVAAEHSESVAVPALEDAPLDAETATAPASANAGASRSADGDSVVHDTGDGTSQRTVGLIAGGVGLLGIGAGAYFTIRRSGYLSDRDNVCPSTVNCTAADLEKNDQLTKDARSATTLSLIGYGAGGAFLITGIVLYVTAPKASSSARLRVTPWLSSSSAGLGAVSRW
jgi:hypothetical protein